MNIEVKDTKPLISVIVPCYKVEKYLSKCVDSILKQTYKNLEIWLVDDGSPDRCGQICDDFSKKDYRIKVIHKENGGLSDARNTAVEVANGEWISFIDSDDYVAENYFEQLYFLAKEYNCQCSVVQALPFEDGTSPSVPIEKKRIDVLSAQEAIAHMFYQTLLDTSAWNKLYHRSLFKTGIRYPKGFLFEDNPTTYRLLSLCKHIAVCQQKLYYYRIRYDSIEGSDFTPSKLDQGLIILSMMEDHPEITDSIKRSLHCKQLSLAFHFMMKMPLTYNKREDLWYYVKRYRLRVMLDKFARKKTRVACLISYLGVRPMKAVFSLFYRRKV